MRVYLLVVIRDLIAENKEEILKELGFEADYELDKKLLVDDRKEEDIAEKIALADRFVKVQNFLTLEISM